MFVLFQLLCKLLVLVTQLCDMFLVLCELQVLGQQQFQGVYLGPAHCGCVQGEGDEGGVVL